MTRNKKRNTSSTGVRYTGEQKKEIVKFVADYNAAKGRGGQNAAAKKFKVTPLTISSWLKDGSAKPAKPAVKNAAAKTGKKTNAAKSARKIGRGIRYSPERKKEVVDFVVAYNKTNGRGGQNQAARKFNLSVLTVSSWLKNAGVAPKPAKAAKIQGAKRLLAQISRMESALSALKAAIESKA